MASRKDVPRQRLAARQPLRHGLLASLIALTCLVGPSAAQPGAVTTLAGSGSAAYADGPRALASFHLMQHMAVSPDGATLYGGGNFDHRIRSIVVSTGAVTTLAGSGSAAYADGTGASASFKQPAGVAVSPDGATLYVAEYGNHRIRSIVVSTGAVTTLAGTGVAGYTDDAYNARFDLPWSVAISPNGTALYSAGNDCRIREVRSPLPLPHLLHVTYSICSIPALLAVPPTLLLSGRSRRLAAAAYLRPGHRPQRLLQPVRDRVRLHRPPAGRVGGRRVGGRRGCRVAPDHLSRHAADGCC